MAVPASECLFCKIIAGQIPCKKILETSKTLAFLDIFPLSKGHSLIVPKAHAYKMEELDDESLAESMVIAKKGLHRGFDGADNSTGSESSRGRKLQHFAEQRKTGTPGLSFWYQMVCVTYFVGSSPCSFPYDPEAGRQLRVRYQMAIQES